MSSVVMIGGAVGYALVMCIALVLRPRMSPGYMGRAFRSSASMRLGSGSILLGLIVTFVLGGLLGTAGAVIGVALLVIGWAAAAVLNDDVKRRRKDSL